MILENPLSLINVRPNRIILTNGKHPVKPGGVGHDSQSVPGEIFARAHFHLIAEGQTSPRVESGVEIM